MQRRELNEQHDKLCTALGNKTRFTRKEWAGFGITDLREPLREDWRPILQATTVNATATV